MEPREMAEKINSKEMQVKELADQLGVNTTTVQRRLKSAGYKFNKDMDQWILEGDAPTTQEPKKKDKQEVKEPKQPEKRKVIMTESNPTRQIKKVTYEIDERIHDELRIKAIRDKRSVSAIVEELLRRGLEL